MKKLVDDDDGRRTHSDGNNSHGLSDELKKQPERPIEDLSFRYLNGKSYNFVSFCQSFARIKTVM